MTLIPSNCEDGIVQLTQFNITEIGGKMNTNNETTHLLEDVNIDVKIKLSSL